MDEPSDVPPDTLGVTLQDGGIVVAYSDGREAFYHGIPEQVSSPHQTAPGKEVHVLVTDETETQGVLLYVNDHMTADEILAGSGVGRILLGQGETTTLFPGVTISRGQLRFEIDVDHELVDGRVFVFEEDQFQEFSCELVPPAEDDQ